MITMTSTIISHQTETEPNDTELLISVDDYINQIILNKLSDNGGYSRKSHLQVKASRNQRRLLEYYRQGACIALNIAIDSCVTGATVSLNLNQLDLDKGIIAALEKAGGKTTLPAISCVRRSVRKLHIFRSSKIVSKAAKDAAGVYIYPEDMFAYEIQPLIDELTAMAEVEREVIQQGYPTDLRKIMQHIKDLAESAHLDPEQTKDFLHAIAVRLPNKKEIANAIVISLSTHKIQSLQETSEEDLDLLLTENAIKEAQIEEDKLNSEERLLRLAETERKAIVTKELSAFQLSLNEARQSIAITILSEMMELITRLEDVASNRVPAVMRHSMKKIYEMMELVGKSTSIEESYAGLEELKTFFKGVRSGSTSYDEVSAQFDAKLFALKERLGVQIQTIVESDNRKQADSTAIAQRLQSIDYSLFAN